MERATSQAEIFIYLHDCEVFWALLNVQPPHANSDSTGRDEDNSVTFSPEAAGCFNKEGEVGEERFMSFLVAD